MSRRLLKLQLNNNAKGARSPAIPYEKDRYVSHVFDPQAALKPGVETIENAVIVPWGKEQSKGIARPAAVFYADGTLCETAVCYRSVGRETTLPTAFPAEDEITETVDETVLFGGIGYGHFGHALCESLGRLWPLDDPDYEIDSVYFMPKVQKTWVKNALNGLTPLLRTLDVKQRAFASNTPIRVKRLIVPPQGFGVHEMILGAPEFRRFMRNRLKADAPHDTGHKIFISRSKLYGKRGRILQEVEIEEHLQAEGYEVFHPQEHNLQTQLDTYRSAGTVISTDNSALHLAAFVLSKGAKVAILIRRPGGIYKDFVGQLSQFAEIDPVIIDTGVAYWAKKAKRVQFNEVYTQADFPKMGAALAAAGFIENGSWGAVQPDAVHAQIARLSESLGFELAPVSPPSA